MSRTSQPVDNELVRLFDLSLDAFCIAGFDGYLKLANPAFARMLGYTQDELLARPFMDNVHPDDRESVGAVLAELADGKDIVGFECRQVRADGSVRWLEWNTHSRPEEGVVYGVARDVTDRRGGDAELNALRRLATLVAEGVQPQDLFAVVAEEVSRVVDVPAVSVVRYEPDGTATECANFNMGEKHFPIGARWSIEGTNILRLVRDNAATARIDDYSGLEGEMAEIVRRSGIRSTVGIPIVVAGRVWGTIVGSTTEPEPLPGDTESRLADFTELLATAIENGESHEALERLVDEQAALRRVATLVAHGVRPDEIFAAVSNEVGRLVGTDSAAVVRFVDDGPGIVFVGVASKMRGAFPLGAHWRFEDGMASAEVYRTGRSARSGARDWSTVEGPVGETHHRLGIVSAVASPIVVEGRGWGAMTVQSQGPLPPETEERLERFTELLASAIANAESHAALTRLAEEQAALRRVATLVARGVRPDEIFAAVSDEVGRLVGTDSATVIRYDDDGEGISYVGSASKVSGAFPVGVHWKFQDGMASFEVYRTGRSARSGAHLITVDGPIGETHRRMGIISAVASPIVVEGRLWGAMAVHGQEPLPPDTEGRLEKFTELVATAIANADSRDELAASRRRIFAASDEARRRIERDLHDGTQQRLVTLLLQLAALKEAAPTGEVLVAGLSRIESELASALDELHEMSRGIHPSILSEGGLRPALRALARRSTIPVKLDVTAERRLAEPIEAAAYFVASEALANATKHAQASRIDLSLAPSDSGLMLSIRDDGVGGADSGKGSGLVGLHDRVEALGGTIRIESPPGAGTLLVVALPLEVEPAG
ncbi:MAG: hypothetical protein QOD48_1297 [Gaiellaceae bacterium]|nr:hypothetical protein [Gaiellaceae bacterium]